MDPTTSYKPGWIQKPVKFLLSNICLQLDSSESQTDGRKRIMQDMAKRNATLYPHFLCAIQHLKQLLLDPDPPVDVEINKLENNRIFHHWKHPKL